MSKTKIEWADMTINPVVGCSKCSPGCDNCYAEKMAARLAKMPQTAAKYAGVVDECGKWTGIIDFEVSCLLRLPKNPKRIFVGSMCDLFHDSVMDSHLAHIMGHIGLTGSNTHHAFILLTKRPERMKEFFTHWKPYREIKNVWLGVTVCNQAEADKKIPLLLDTPAAKRFVSVEPMLGPVDLSLYTGNIFCCHDCGHRELVCSSGCPSCGRVYAPSEDASSWVYCEDCKTSFLNNEICVCSECGGKTSSPSASLDWVICGGETGPKARPMHPDWVRGLRDQCEAAGVPFFFKGWGEWTPAFYQSGGFQVNSDADIPHGYAAMYHVFPETPEFRMYKVGKRRSGRLLDGREWNEVPA